MDSKYIIYNFIQPIKFTQNLETLQTQFPAISNDFKKYYVFYNKNPEYQEYENIFENIKENLNTVISQLFSLSNDVQLNTNKINEKLFSLDFLIKREKEKNNDFKSKLGIIQQKTSASSELISNYKDIYNLEYLRNWALFLSIIIVGATSYKLFTPFNNYP